MRLNRPALLLLLLHCSHVSMAADVPEDRRVFNDSTGMDALIGSDVDELISRMGQPERILTLPTGKRAFAYDAGPHTRQREDGSRCADAYVVDNDNMIVDYYCR